VTGQTRIEKRDFAAEKEARGDGKMGAVRG
jgi:hypothetical protein